MDMSQFFEQVDFGELERKLEQKQDEATKEAAALQDEGDCEGCKI